MTEMNGFVLRAADVRHALREHLSGRVDAHELESWAERLHSDESVELDDASGGLVAQAVFELSTPELFGSMDVVVGSLWARLGVGDEKSDLRSALVRDLAGTSRPSEDGVVEVGAGRAALARLPEAPLPEERFFDRIVRVVWEPGEVWDRHVVDAAVLALVEGLDSPSLRILAGQRADESEATQRHLMTACAELGVPHPPRYERWVPVEWGGRTWRRLATDRMRLRCEIQHTQERRGVELRAMVNDIDLCIGFGDDPFHLLLPVVSHRCDRFASENYFFVDRCEWGPGHIVVSRDDTAVHWDWVVPGHGRMAGGASFPLEEYDEEIERIHAELARTRDVQSRSPGQGTSDESWAPPVPMGVGGLPKMQPLDLGDARRRDQARAEDEQWRAEFTAQRVEALAVAPRLASRLWILGAVLLGVIVVGCAIELLIGRAYGAEVNLLTRPWLWASTAMLCLLWGRALWMGIAARRARREPPSPGERR